MTKVGLDDYLASGKTLVDLKRCIVDQLPDRPERSAARPIYRRMSAVEPRQVESLWPGYIVKRKLNLLAGYGGVGKDQLMANIIARGSTGRPFPSTQLRTSFRTLILAAEDDAHEDWRPRLDANGADVDEVLILDGIAEGDGPVRWVDIKQHTPLVEQVVKDERIDLVYISPLSAYMPGVTRRDAGDVRDTLGYIQRLIDQTGVTVIATLHIGKAATERRGALKILDSVEFVNAARNVLAVNDLPDEHQPDEVLEDPTRGRRKVLEVVKANSTIPGPPLAFSRPLDAAVQWHGVAPVGFDESFHVTERDRPRQDAKDWLWDRLRGGMQRQAELEHGAKDAGIAKATLNRAKDDLGVQSKKLEFSGPWYWMLPAKHTGHEEAHPDQVSALVDAEDAHAADASPLAQSRQAAHQPIEVSTFGANHEAAHQPHIPEVSPLRPSRPEDMAPDGRVCAECGAPTTGSHVYSCPAHGGRDAGESAGAPVRNADVMPMQGSM